MLDTYAGAFVELAFYGQAADVFFPVDGGTPRISNAVAQAPWPTFGEAKVFGTSSERVTSELGYHSFLVDGFENANIDVSDSGLVTAITGMSLEESPSGAGALMDNFHMTRVGLAVLTQDAAGEFSSSVSWRLSCEALEALVESTSVTFRFGIQRTITNEDPCEGEAVDLPEVRMFITTPSGRVDVDVGAFSRIELPDARLESGVICNAAGAGAAPPCRAFGSMQATIRIPTDFFCESGITLDQATHIGVEFSSADEGRAVIIDDVEFKRIPGQPGVSCRCSPRLSADIRDLQ